MRSLSSKIYLDMLSFIATAFLGGGLVGGQGGGSCLGFLDGRTLFHTFRGMAKQ